MDSSAEYDRIGDLYEVFKKGSAFAIPERALMLKLLGDPAGLDVIDLACGYGSYTREALRAGARRAIGVDISRVMVNLARVRTKSASGRIEFFQHDVRSLQKIGDFDIATAVWLLHYAESKSELTSMLVGARNNLKSGGRLAAVTVHPDFVPGRSDWLPYGLRADDFSERERRHLIRAQLLTPDDEIKLEYSRWDASVYEESALEAGFTDIRWTLPEIPAEEVERREEGFWDVYLSNPCVAGFEALAC